MNSDAHDADQFRSRLSKRARHFRRWPGRGIHCYRLYERDIPEIPLVLDRYEECLHVTEYERPHSRTDEQHQVWLERMLQTACETLEVDPSRVFFKSRVKIAAESGRAGQYRKVDQRNVELEVQEQGLKFLVNLSDYVDTGLFLDHRVTRSMVRQRAQGKDVLNLFGYTGSFSVYAADGGASSTVTVDLSRTYLDWAGRNFEINGLLGPQHRFVVSDTIAYLNSVREQGEQFDLAIVDPPTFSNSKKVKSDWDVQTGHVRLLNLLEPVMRPGGGVYFSTNFRRFKFHEDEIRFQIREITNQTVPEDFRNKRIHRCWWLQKAE